MTIIRHQKVEAEKPVVGDQWTQIDQVVVDVVQRLPDLPKDVILMVSCEYAGVQLNKEVAVRVLVDGSEVAIDHFRPSITNAYRTFTVTGMKHCDNDTFFYLTLQARAIDASQTVKVRRRRLVVMQH